MFLEIVAVSVNDIIKINKTKANQIELCSNMKQGGFTPDYDVIRACTELSKIPVRVMVRRSSDGFSISEEEFQQLLADVKFIKTTKATGIVCGVLTNEGKIDIKRMQQIIELAKPLRITFHRAFDEINDHKAALNQLINLNVDIVLTSGGTKPILENLGNIQQLKNLNLPIKILLGAGINFNNINIFNKQQLTNIHVAKCVRVDESIDKPISIEAINKIIAIFN